MKITGSKVAGVGILPVQRVEKIAPLDNNQPPRVPDTKIKQENAASPATGEATAAEPSVVLHGRLAGEPAATVDVYGKDGKLTSASGMLRGR